MPTSREGVTLDVISAPLRRWLLNPIIAVPAALAVLGLRSCAQLLFNKGAIIAQAPVYLLAVSSVLLSLNEYLDKQFANNWVSDKTWDWDKEIVVVTGGSGGIGASICKQLLARNPRTRIVVVDYAPLGWKPDREGARLSYYQCDLSDTNALRSTCERIRNEVGHPTVLFNNAGLVRGASIMEGSYGDIEATIRTNLIAPMLLIKEFIPEMVKNDHGHILHTGSLSCMTPPALIADYSATKAGLLAMHELELKHVYKAPRVRLTLGIFCFIRTPLISGHPNVPNFLMPFLHVDTVGESMVDAVYSGYGSIIYLPGINRVVATLRGGPEWFFRLVRESTANFRIDFRGRQELDKETGRLQKA
ncbi:short-chain dehydrogenase [Trichoderma arundinaceum]|uniref:Short-chain dehydrogenase n=1 Tax=Trichoderma arundinaceum TaxID=490622 RepID=A0A395NYM4_TRIAR|nr:short-chain dehydrogenase [Trichoderma arundinaceum]